jgi:drug/metabolite transporter (DMT)-like permease
MEIYMPASKRMTAHEWLLLIFLSFLWGGSFFLAEISLREMQPLTLAFLRMAVAALALALAVAVLRLSYPRRLSTWGAFFVMGAFSSCIPFALMYYGQSHITGAHASILNATAPLFTGILAHIFTRDEKLNTRRTLGVLAGMCGVAVIVGPSAVLDGDTQILPQAAVLGAAFCYGIAGVYGKRFWGISPVVTAFGQLVFGAVFMLPAMLLIEHPFSRPLPGLVTIAAIVALALLSTALAFIVYFRILTRAGATNAVLVTLLVPVSAILLGVVILKEIPDARQFSGMALIACGLLIVDGRALDYFRKRAMPDAAGLNAPHMLNERQDL